MADFCLTLICPPTVEEKLLDVLLANAGSEVFTSTPTHSHGSGQQRLSATEQVMGRSRAMQVNVLLTNDELGAIAVKIGSDVPFFLYGGTAFGMGRGDIIEPSGDLDEQLMLIVTPEISVSTREAFERLNALTLTNDARKRILRVCRLEAESLDLHHSVLKNDFEESVFGAYPEIGRVKRTLLDLGAVNAAMSGSGASVFAIFDKTETRQAALKALDGESTWRKFAVATISQREYCEALWR